MYKYYPSVQVDGRQVRKHRYVMENYLGRKLLSSELVHHKNDDVNDNSIDNLELTTRSDHKKLHREIGAGTQFKSKINVTKDELITMYKTMTLYGIAEVFGVTHAAILWHMKKHNLGRRNRGNKPNGN